MTRQASRQDGNAHGANSPIPKVSI